MNIDIKVIQILEKKALFDSVVAGYKNPSILKDLKKGKESNLMIKPIAYALNIMRVSSDVE